MIDEVLSFWFEELSSKDWFKKDENLDQMIKKRFKDLHLKASLCELYSYRKSSKGRLAEVIILDQFSRNIYRDQKEAFLYDGQALTLAQEAVNLGIDNELSLDEKRFLYLPYMHSESSIIHEKAVELFSIKGLENELEFEFAHKSIIDRFGRYPHRNKVLGRESTQEEIEFLKRLGSSF